VQITYATELTNTDISVYALMKLLGHDSMVTSQRYAVGPAPRTVPRQPGIPYMASSICTQPNP
jgi:hypothetical protein